MPTTVYRSRSRTTRHRLLAAAGVLGLVLTGFLIGRAQSADEPAAAAAQGSPAQGSPAQGSPAQGSPGPPVESPAASPSPTPAAPVGGIDAYAPLQVEDAAEVVGTDMQDTADTGGGRNAGWINGGDRLRFDEVNFGAEPPASVNFRVASEAPAGGRIEIRIDSPDAAPVATLSTSHTGGWQNWRTETTPMSPVTGLHTVYVTFGNERPDDFLNINWLVFRR